MEDKLIIFGVIVILSSGTVFNYRLYTLNKLLKEKFPELWEKYGTGNKNIHMLAQFQRLRSLAVEYTSDDPGLRSLLSSIAMMQAGFVIGAVIVVIGVLI